MTRLVDLTVALSSYDHTLDLTKGQVEIAGTRPDFVEPVIGPDVSQKWDVAEIPLVAYAKLRAAGDDSLVAIPVFTSRLFPHHSIFVRADRVSEPGDLRGARVGISAWPETTAFWARGMLSDMYGLAPADMRWIQGPVAGSAEPVDPAELPVGVSLTHADRDLAEMLIDGELDALIASSAHERLSAAIASDRDVKRLFAEPSAAERAYYEKTACLPPLRTVAIRAEVLETQPWIASNLYRAFEVSKRRYFVRLTEISASRTAIPWTSAYVSAAQKVFGDDLWPYGVESNRSSLEVFLRYGTEQQLFAAPLVVADLFASVEPFVDGLI